MSESESTQETRLANAQHFLTRVGHRDFAETIELLSEDVTYKAPGDHALAGVFVGRDEVANHLSALLERPGGTLDVLKWEDWMQGDHFVSALADLHVQGEGTAFTGRVLFLARFDVHDKIDEITVFFEDERAIARLFGP